MGKARKKTTEPRGPLARLLQRERVEQDNAPIVNEFAAQHGDYEPLGKYNGAARVLVNRKVSPLDGWFAEAGPGFDEPQKRAMEYLERLWRLADSGGRLTANYGGMSRGEPEGTNHFEAVTELGEWRSAFGRDYWNVTENVIRFGEPAGTAGSKLASNRPQAAAAAKAIVGLVLSVIATRKHF